MYVQTMPYNTRSRSKASSSLVSPQPFSLTVPGSAAHQPVSETAAVAPVRVTVAFTPVRVAAAYVTVQETAAPADAPAADGRVNLIDLLAGTVEPSADTLPPGHVSPWHSESPSAAGVAPQRKRKCREEIPDSGAFDLEDVTDASTLSAMTA